MSEITDPTRTSAPFNRRARSYVAAAAADAWTRTPVRFGRYPA